MRDVPRFVKVFHSEQSDFGVVVPDDVEDVDKFLDAVLHGAAGWKTVDGPQAAIADANIPTKRWIKGIAGTIFCPECGEAQLWSDYRARFCDTCGTELLPEEGYGKEDTLHG